MKWRKCAWLDFLARLFVGGIFIYAAVPKIIDPCAFARSIYAYKVFPGVLVNLSAIFVPWFELCGGLALILGVWRRGANAIISILLVMFIVLLGVVFIQGVNIDCGCFKSSNGLCQIISARLCRMIYGAKGCGSGRFLSACEITRDLCYLAPALFSLAFKGKRWSILPRSKA